MIPYWAPPPFISLFGSRTSVFGLLLFAAFLTSYVVLLLRGRKVAIAPPREVDRFAKVVLLAALGGAQIWGVLREHGASALSTPSLFFSAQGSLPSAAGALTATLAAVIYLRVRKLDLRAFADLVAYAFPFGWLFARAACGLSHDHPGRPSTSFLAVRFPEGSRFDCGLLEWLATPFLIALVVLLGRGQRRPGLLAAALGASYGVLRFSLDFLRASDLPGSDSRLGALTFAQWMCLPLFAAALWLARGRRAAAA